MQPDYDAYLSMFENMDMTLEEKKDYINQIWGFLNHTVESAFNNPDKFEKLTKLVEDTE